MGGPPTRENTGQCKKELTGQAVNKSHWALNGAR